MYYSLPFLYLYVNKDKKEIVSNSEKIILNLRDNLLFKDLGEFLVEKKILQNSKTINSLVEYKGYSKEQLIKGKYTINKNWSNNKLINQLYIMRNQNLIFTHYREELHPNKVELFYLMVHIIILENNR